MTYVELLMAEVKLLMAEIEDLRHWKAEAIQVITEWELVWDAMGRPGRLGESKSAACVADALLTAALRQDEADQ